MMTEELFASFFIFLFTERGTVKVKLVFNVSIIHKYTDFRMIDVLECGERLCEKNLENIAAIHFSYLPI